YAEPDGKSFPIPGGGVQQARSAGCNGVPRLPLKPVGCPSFVKEPSVGVCIQCGVLCGKVTVFVVHRLRQPRAATGSPSCPPCRPTCPSASGGCVENGGLRPTYAGCSAGCLRRRFQRRDGGSHSAQDRTALPYAA